jgi:uncharacterized protein (TIGR02594 family)
MRTAIALRTNLKVREALPDCPWIRFAIGEIGQGEIPGKARHNPRILQYHGVVGISHGGDETPWCSSFVNWCMQMAGVPGSGKGFARSWLQWGHPLSTTYPVFGCIAVFSRGVNPAQGHVGFLVGLNAHEAMILGGNQKGVGHPTGEVCVRPYAKSRLLGVRWPGHLPTTARLRHLVADGE